MNIGSTFNDIKYSSSKPVKSVSAKPASTESKKTMVIENGGDHAPARERVPMVTNAINGYDDEDGDVEFQEKYHPELIYEKTTKAISKPYKSTLKTDSAVDILQGGKSFYEELNGIHGVGKNSRGNVGKSDGKVGMDLTDVSKVGEELRDGNGKTNAEARGVDKTVDVRVVDKKVSEEPRIVVKKVSEEARVVDRQVSEGLVKGTTSKNEVVKTGDGIDSSIMKKDAAVVGSKMNEEEKGVNGYVAKVNGGQVVTETSLVVSKSGLEVEEFVEKGSNDEKVVTEKGTVSSKVMVNEVKQVNKVVRENVVKDCDVDTGRMNMISKTSAGFGVGPTAVEEMVTKVDGDVAKRGDANMLCKERGQTVRRGEDVKKGGLVEVERVLYDKAGGFADGKVGEVGKVGILSSSLEDLMDVAIRDASLGTTDFSPDDEIDDFSTSMWYEKGKTKTSYDKSNNRNASKTKGGLGNEKLFCDTVKAFHEDNGDVENVRETKIAKVGFSTECMASPQVMVFKPKVQSDAEKEEDLVAYRDSRVEESKDLVKKMEAVGKLGEKDVSDVYFPMTKIESRLPGVEQAKTVDDLIENVVPPKVCDETPCSLSGAKIAAVESVAGGIEKADGGVSCHAAIKQSSSWVSTTGTRTTADRTLFFDDVNDLREETNSNFSDDSIEIPPYDEDPDAPTQMWYDKDRLTAVNKFKSFRSLGTFEDGQLKAKTDAKAQCSSISDVERLVDSDDEKLERRDIAAAGDEVCVGVAKFDAISNVTQNLEKVKIAVNNLSNDKVFAVDTSVVVKGELVGKCEIGTSEGVVEVSKSEMDIIGEFNKETLSALVDTPPSPVCAPIDEKPQDTGNSIHSSLNTYKDSGAPPSSTQLSLDDTKSLQESVRTNPSQPKKSGNELQSLQQEIELLRKEIEVASTVQTSSIALITELKECLVETQLQRERDRAQYERGMTVLEGLVQSLIPANITKSNNEEPPQNETRPDDLPTKRESVENENAFLRRKMADLESIINAQDKEIQLLRKNSPKTHLMTSTSNSESTLRYTTASTQTETSKLTIKEKVIKKLRGRKNKDVKNTSANIAPAEISHGHLVNESAETISTTASFPRTMSTKDTGTSLTTPDDPLTSVTNSIETTNQPVHKGSNVSTDIVDLAEIDVLSDLAGDERKLDPDDIKAKFKFVLDLVKVVFGGGKHKKKKVRV
ncbi:hypothetical protein HDU76_003465 [Blyttiomyces sp. JEL0837]|nr:hypothetical protein HDU76_003465 [Blyttiomyces sp. JEL0837]